MKYFIKRSDEVVKNLIGKKRYFIFPLFILQSLLEIFTLIVVLGLIKIIFDGSSYNIFFLKNFATNIQINILASFSIFFITLSFAMTMLINYIIFKLGFKIQNKLIFNLFDLYLKCDYLNISKYSFSKYQSVIQNESRRISTFVIIPYFLTISKVFLITLIGSTLIFINYKISLILIFILAIISFYSSSAFSKKIKKHGIQIFKFDRKILQILSMTYFAFKEIRLNHLTNESNKLLVRYQNKITNTFVENKFLTALLSNSVELFLFIIIFIFLILLNESSSISSNIYSEVSFFIFASIKLMPHIKQLNANFTSIRTHVSSIDNYEKMQKTLINSSKFKSKKKSKKILKINNLNLKNVNFNYPGESKKIISFKNLSFRKKSVIGIYGPSGSGKTTFLDIISGLILLENKNEGLFVNKIKIDENNFLSYYDHVSYVHQKTFFLEDTLKKNIILNREFNKLKYEKICKLTNIKKLLSSKKENEIVNIGREKLSGGQIQRLNIARALYKSPQILILDEATNAMDEKNQQLILKNITKLKNIEYIFLCSHDYNVMKFCDRIIEFKD